MTSHGHILLLYTCKPTAPSQAHVVATVVLFFISQPILRQAHSPYQSQFYSYCDLVLPLSIFSILSFPYGHPVTADVFFLVFPSLVSLLVSSITFFLEDSSYALFSHSILSFLFLLAVRCPVPPCVYVSVKDKIPQLHLPSFCGP
jgi:hypothetical protein